MIYRKSGQRALDELQRTIIEIETKYKSEISRIKKKYESELREYEIQIETVSRTNAELSKNNRAMANKLKVRIKLYLYFSEGFTFGVLLDLSSKILQSKFLNTARKTSWCYIIINTFLLHPIICTIIIRQ